VVVGGGGGVVVGSAWLASFGGSPYCFSGGFCGWGWGGGGCVWFSVDTQAIPHK